jgi:diheme cytochrome c
MGYGMRGFLVVGGVAMASLMLFGLPSGPAWGEHRGEPREERGEGKRTSRLPAQPNAAWQQECASCHVAYPPGLLPQASWRRIMAGLDQHFGENAGLPPQTVAEISAFLAKNAADAGRPAAEGAPAPLRVTETPWFRREHGEVGAAVWKRKAVGSPANCAACHRQAEQGVFNEHGVRIPG